MTSKEAAKFEAHVRDVLGRIADHDRARVIVDADGRKFVLYVKPLDEANADDAKLAGK